MPEPQAVQVTSSTDSAKRSARTGLQGGISAQLLVQGWNLFAPAHLKLSAEQIGWITAASVAVPAMVAFLWNLIEEASGHSILKGGSSLALLNAKLDALAAEVGRLGDALEARGLVRPA